MKARAQITIPGRIGEAEALWYDTSRWASFIDGFHHVVSVDESWPAEGTIVWDSTPDGRGRVAETTERYDPRVEHIVHVEEAKVSGTQTVRFSARDGEKFQMTLELRYQLKEKPGGALSPIVDFFFIRPRQSESLSRTLVRFARELSSDRAIIDN
jgi:uncharacterized membrane protein